MWGEGIEDGRLGMRQRKYLKGSVQIVICMVLVLTFNTIVFPRILSDDSTTGERIQYDATAQWIPVERVSENKQEFIEYSKLDPNVANTILSAEQVIELIKERVSNSDVANYLQYTIKLTKTESPNVPYCYNVIIGDAQRIREVIYLQVNAMTGDILILISQGRLQE